MPSWALTVAYDGTFFGGFQLQRNARTVQAELERALLDLTGEPVRVKGASRTDAGVHAMGQVAAFSSAMDLRPERWMGALNARLPEDVRIMGATAVPDAFDPQRQASAKTYAYLIDRAPSPQPVFRQHAVWCPTLSDLGGMVEAASHFVGRHDFRSVSGDSRRTNTVRTVHEVSIARPMGLAMVVVRGDGFLYHMVRNMVGLLMEVGRGRRRPDEIPLVLEARDRRMAGPTAPSKGLVLVGVEYPDRSLTGSDGFMKIKVGVPSGCEEDRS